MITVYLAKEVEGKTWLRAEEAIPKMGGQIIVIKQGFGQKDRRVFFPSHMIERIEL